jgi:hypothetical protein
VTVLDLLGTGAQAVEAPSIWVGADGRREERFWHEFGEPALVGHAELYAAAAALARECGWQEKGRPQAPRAPRRKAGVPAEVLTVPPMPVGEAARQARSYLWAVPPAVQGQGGDAHTFYVCCRLVRGFGLSMEEAWPLLLEFNARCRPPWTERELRHKLARADDWQGVRGDLVRPTSRRIEVNARPTDLIIYVGLDCAASGRPHILLEPGLWAGFVRLGGRYELAAELRAIDWKGRQAVLTPASTLATNKKEVWEHYHLAEVLRREGASVLSLVPAPLNGRRRTLSRALDRDLDLVEPPQVDEARQAAREAAQRAREQDAARRALPRNKPSPVLEKAVAWLKGRKARRLTKEVKEAAREAGLCEATLRRAMKVVRQAREGARKR